MMDSAAARREGWLPTHTRAWHQRITGCCCIPAHPQPSPGLFLYHAPAHLLQLVGVAHSQAEQDVQVRRVGSKCPGAGRLGGVPCWL